MREHKRNASSWKSRYDELVRYKESHGDCLVPTNFNLNKKLGYWVMTQRRQYALLQNGQKSTLCAEKVKMLDEIGFAWKIRFKSSASFCHRLSQLAAYKAKHGNCLVPQKFSHNRALGTWVNTQRRHYRLLKNGEKSIMTKDRIAALEEIGFEWDPRKLAAKDKEEQSELKHKRNDIVSERATLAQVHPTQDEMQNRHYNQQGCDGVRVECTNETSASTVDSPTNIVVPFDPLPMGYRFCSQVPPCGRPFRQIVQGMRPIPSLHFFWPARIVTRVPAIAFPKHMFFRVDSMHS